MLDKIRQDDSEFMKKTMENFQISITTVKRYLQECLGNGILHEDAEKNSGYALETVSYMFAYEAGHMADEDGIYYEEISPLLEDVSQQAKAIWYYAFTEMMNNAIEHSACQDIKCVVRKDYLYTEISIIDDGVGIYKNIQTYL